LTNAPHVQQKLPQPHRLHQRRIRLERGLDGAVAGVVGVLVRLHHLRQREHLLRLVKRHADLHPSRGRLRRAGIDQAAFHRVGDEQGQVTPAALLLKLDREVGDEDGGCLGGHGDGGWKLEAGS
jgi:hypothetical protein